MKISSCTLALLLTSTSPASSYVSSWSSSSHHHHHRAAFAIRSTAHKSTTSLSSTFDENIHYSLAAIDAASRQASHAADRAMHAAASIPQNAYYASKPPRTLNKKVFAAAAAATAVSSSFPLAVMAAASPSSEAFDAIMDSSSVLLNYVEMVGSLQFLYTAVLVAGVGYTQRMEGREDFKREMAMKIANGEITPEELVEEISVMAAEINQSAEYAFSAQMEVQKLLAEMKAIASPTLQLPSASMSSLTTFDMESTVEEKEYLPAFAEQTQEREERLYWPSDLEVNGGSETELSYTFQEEEGEEEMLSLSSVMETVNEDEDDDAELSLPEEEEYFIPDEVEMEMEDDTDFIAEALLAPPPSLRPIPDVEEVVVEHIETEMLADDQTTQPHQAELEHMDASPIPDAEEVVAKEVVPEFSLANDNDETTQTHLAEVDHLVASPIPDAEELIAEPIEIEMLLENDHDQTAQPHQAELDHLDVSQQTKEEEERKLLEEKRDAIRQQAQAIRSSFKSSSSSSSSSSSESLDEDVSNAFKLAEEALASAALDEEVSHASKFAEEALASAALEEEVSHALKFAEEALASADMHDLTKGVEVTNNIPMVTQEQSFASPAPPESPPPLALVMEGIEVEAPINPQPEIKVTMPKENLGPVRSSPLARVLAGELGVKIEDVFPGSGLKGRVVADDVREYAATMTNV